MNRKDHDREKMLAELFHGDWTGSEAEGFARRAAAHARHRQGIRRALVAATAMTAIALALLISLPRRPATPRNVSTPPPTADVGYEIISDGELLVQLRDQPLLVVQRDNGSREIVLLGN